MKTTTISILRSNIKSYIDGVIGTDEPILVNKGNNGAVIISLAEYNRLTSNQDSTQCHKKVNHTDLPINKNNYYVDVDINQL